MKKRVLLLLFLLLMHFFLLFNLRFEAWPEMILYPWLMSKGFFLYQDIINPYLPFLSWMLFFFFKIAGFTILNLKIFTWILILLTDFLVFYVSLKFWKKTKIAFFSLAFFIFWQPYLDGNGLWHDLATTPFLLLAFYFFYQFLSKKNNRQKLLLSGFFLAVAFFIKQTVIYFYLISLLYILLQKNKKILSKFSQAILLVLPLAIFLLLSSFYFYSQGILNDFLFWSLKFPFFILSKTSGHRQFPNLRQLVLTLIPFSPLIFFLRLRVKEKKLPVKEQEKHFLLLASFLASVLFILPRWGLFHLQPALAFFSILAGQLFFSLLKDRRRISLLIFTGIILLSLCFQVRFIKRFWHQETRFFEKEIQSQAQWLKDNTRPEELVFNLNAPDQLYFLAERLPIKPWLINFSWYYEASDLKTRVLASLEKEPPEMVIYSSSLKGEAFSPGVYQPVEIKEWIFENYQSYFKIGETEFLRKIYKD